MVNICYLCGYNSSRSKKVKRSVYRFPSIPEVRAAWIDACGLDAKTDDVSRIKICSMHFLPGDFLPQAVSRGGTMGMSYFRLKSGTVPTVAVPVPPASVAPVETLYIPTDDLLEVKEEYLEVKEEPPLEVTTTVKSSPSPEIRQIEDDDELIEHSYSCTSFTEMLTKRKTYDPRYISEIRPSDLATPDKVRRVLYLIKRSHEIQAKKIRALRKENGNLKRRVATLEDLISDML